MILELMKYLALPISGLVTYFMGHYIGRKKTTAEIDKLELDNLSAVVLFYKNTFLDLKAELEILSSRCKDLTEEIETLREENKDLKVSLGAITQQLKRYENTKTK